MERSSKSSRSVPGRCRRTTPKKIRDDGRGPRSKDAPKKENVLINEKGELVVLDDEAEPAADDPAIEIAVKPLAEPNVFKIRRAAIKSLIYFEDMLLAEGDRLVDPEGVRESLRALSGREVTRAGLAGAGPAREPAAVRRRHARRSAQTRWSVGSGCWVSSMRGTEPHPGLSDALASAYGGRVERAFQEAAFVEGRRELTGPGGARGRSTRRQRRCGSGSSSWRSRHRQTAGSAESPAQRLDALTAAARVWPALEGLKAEYEAAFEALPTLSVGVSDVPTGSWTVESVAGLRSAWAA